MRLIEVASGVDALYLSGTGALRSLWRERLESAKADAIDRQTAVSFDVGGVELGLQPFGWQKYAYRLEHPSALIGLTFSQSLPAVRVQPRAEFLRGVGPDRAVAWVEGVLSPVVENLGFKTSRIDLFVDLQGWDVEASVRDRFVTRATAVDMHEREGRFTGFEFGRRSGGAMVGRIYDKTADVKSKGSDWWGDVWGDRRRVDEAVWRVELEFGRSVLREFGIGSPQSALDGRRDLWNYATEWLSYRVPSVDETRSRWPVADEWKLVQRAFLDCESVGLERVRQSARTGSIRRLLPGFCGYASSLAALYGVDSISEAMPHLERALYAGEELSGVPFRSRVYQKMAKSRWS